MTEPGNTAAACVAAGTGAITICGSIVGLHYDALLLGFLGGMVSLMVLPPMGPLRVGGTLFTASLLGGALAPFAPAVAGEYAAFLVKAGETPLRLAFALVVGVCAQLLIGRLFSVLRKDGGAAS